MSDKNFDSRSYIEFMSDVANIDIKEEWKDEVAMHIHTAKKMMSIIESVKVHEDSIDLAPTFHPKN